MIPELCQICQRNPFDQGNPIMVHFWHPRVQMLLCCCHECCTKLICYAYSLNPDKAPLDQELMPYIRPQAEDKGRWN